MRRAHIALPFALAACINAPPLRSPPEALALVTVESPTGDLDALGRVPSLALRFDRDIAWPLSGAAMLVTGSASDALRTDAFDGALSASNVSRLVDVSLTRDPRNASVLHVDAREPLLPDAPLTLLVSSLVRAEDDGVYEPANGAHRAFSIALTVAPARRCGALARVEAASPGDAPSNTSRVFVRFDRPVRSSSDSAPLWIAPDGAPSLSSRSALDCLDGAFARCAWIEPAERLSPDVVYRVGFVDLSARHDAPVEAALDAFATGPHDDAPAVMFGPSPVCASYETAAGDFCLRRVGEAFELRASTTAPSLVRVIARSVGSPDSVALGEGEPSHRVLVRAPHDDAMYALTVECLGLDGRVADSRTLDPIASGPGAPRVRISEVLSRPHSTSAQEFVELINDGADAVSLAGWSIAQGTVRSVMPDDATIAAGARAVVVGPSFDPRGVSARRDPAVAAGATLIVLRTAIASRGLRDSGADIALLDASGRILSQVPGSAEGRAPREGVSLVRAEMDLDDLDPAAWAYDSEETSTPGAPDHLR